MWHSAKLTELRPRQKTPFGRMGRFNFAFIVCVSSVNGGMAPGEMETIFATEYGIRMCSPFSAGIARRSAIQPKIFFSQPNGEDQSPRSDTSATNGILLRNQICVRHCSSLRQFGRSSLWVAKALCRRDNQKKKIFCVACGATDFFFNRSPRGWGGLGRSVYLPFLECVFVLK